MKIITIFLLLVFIGCTDPVDYNQKKTQVEVLSTDEQTRPPGIIPPDCQANHYFNDFFNDFKSLDKYYKDDLLLKYSDTDYLENLKSKYILAIVYYANEANYSEQQFWDYYLKQSFTLKYPQLKNLNIILTNFIAHNAISQEEASDIYAAEYSRFITFLDNDVIDSDVRDQLISNVSPTFNQLSK